MATGSWSVCPVCIHCSQRESSEGENSNCQTLGLASQSSCNFEIRNILQESQPVQLLEDVEIIPLQNIELTDGLNLARSPRYRTQALSNDLPAERWYETDGVAPAVGSRCPVQFPSHITRTG